MYDEELQGVKPGQVYDSGGSFFVVTSIEKENLIEYVIGDIISDDEMVFDEKLGRSAMFAVWSTKYLESVLDHHIWGAFYKERGSIKAL